MGVAGLKKTKRQQLLEWSTSMRRQSSPAKAALRPGCSCIAREASARRPGREQEYHRLRGGWARRGHRRMRVVASGPGDPRRQPLSEKFTHAVGQREGHVDPVAQRGSAPPASPAQLFDQAGGDPDRAGSAENFDQHHFAIARRSCRYAMRRSRGTGRRRSTLVSPGWKARRTTACEVRLEDRRITPSASLLAISVAISASGHFAGRPAALTTERTPIVRSSARHWSTTRAKK